jgi:hypothetical protein
MNAKKARMLRKFATDNHLPEGFVKRQYLAMATQAKDRHVLTLIFGKISNTLGELRQKGTNDQIKISR